LPGTTGMAAATYDSHYKKRVLQCLSNCGSFFYFYSCLYLFKTNI